MPDAVRQLELWPVHTALVCENQHIWSVFNWTLSVRYWRRVWRTADTGFMRWCPHGSLWMAFWCEPFCPGTTRPWWFRTGCWASYRCVEPVKHLHVRILCISSVPVLLAGVPTTGLVCVYRLGVGWRLPQLSVSDGRRLCVRGPEEERRGVPQHGAGWPLPDPHPEKGRYRLPHGWCSFTRPLPRYPVMTCLTHLPSESPMQFGCHLPARRGLRHPLCPCVSPGCGLTPEQRGNSFFIT